MTAVWAALVGATCVSLAVGTEAAAIPLAIAFAKARWIGLEFMELRDAPQALRGIFEAWILVVAVTLEVLYVAR